MLKQAVTVTDISDNTPRTLEEIRKYTRHSSKNNFQTRAENCELTPADKCLE